MQDVDDAPSGTSSTASPRTHRSLVREEIELAKAEIELKAKKLARGAAVGAAAGFFVLLGLIFAFDTLAWGINDATGSCGWAS